MIGTERIMPGIDQIVPNLHAGEGWEGGRVVSFPRLRSLLSYRAHMDIPTSITTGCRSMVAPMSTG